MPIINLQSILSEYENNLCDRVFKYELENNAVIEVVFYREQMCHLLGLQYVYPKNRKFLGMKGFEKIKSGKLTIDDLKKYNGKKTKFIKERLYNFGSVFDLMLNGDLIKFYQDRAYPPSLIDADFIIFKKDKAHILHLFLRQEQMNSTLYVPVSFVIKSLDDNNPDQFINNQEYKKILCRAIEKRA